MLADRLGVWWNGKHRSFKICRATALEGSIPSAPIDSFPENLYHVISMLPSSSGPGYWIFTPVTRVRISAGAFHSHGAVAERLKAAVLKTAGA